MGKGLSSVHLSFPVCFPAGAPLCGAPRARVRPWLERQEGDKSAWGHPASSRDCFGDKQTGGGGTLPPSTSSPALTDTGAPPAPPGSPPNLVWGASSPSCPAPPELSQGQVAAGVCLRGEEGTDLGGARQHPWEPARRGCLLVRARAGLFRKAGRCSRAAAMPGSPLKEAQKPHPSKRGNGAASAPRDSWGN